MVVEANRGLIPTDVSSLRYDAENYNQFESSAKIAQLIRPYSRVLDVGCGTGSVTKVLKALSKAEIVGLEPNQDRADTAKKAGIEVICGYLDEQMLPRIGQFDAVVFADVLEHLVDPFEMLLLAKRFLRTGGRVIASVPNVAHWTVRLKLLCGNFDYRPTGLMDATHLRWFTKRSLSQLFVDAGFQVELVTHSGGSFIGGYQKSPLRLVPQDARDRLIWNFGRVSHGLFAFQHVIAGTPKARHTDPPHS